MDLNLENILEVNEIRKLIEHKKNLLEFFNELIEIKNIMINEDLDYESSDYDSDDSYDSSNYSSPSPR
tara:strand:+ start:1684 stop:1887 length:204 start_codon:yes stop_codon:yes gene_type:complete